MEDFEIKPVVNQELKIYEVKDFEDKRAILVDYLESVTPTYTEIKTEDQRSDIKSTRTKIRKKLSYIEETRKDFQKRVFGTFENQAKDLEKLIKKHDEKFKKMIEDFDEKTVVPEPEPIPVPVPTPQYILKISGDLQEKIEKVAEFAQSLGLDVERNY